MAKFDFSKLGVAEVPTKEVEIAVNGETFKIEIKPLTGENRLTLGLFYGNDEQTCMRRIKFSVKAGADMTDEDLEAAFNSPCGWMFIAQLSKEIISYTYDLEEELIAAKAELEKNSPEDATAAISAAD